MQMPDSRQKRTCKTSSGSSGSSSSGGGSSGGSGGGGSSSDDGQPQGTFTRNNSKGLDVDGAISYVYAMT